MTAGSRKCGDPILLPLEVDWTPHFRPWGMGRIAFVPPPMEPPAVQFSGGKGEGGGEVSPSVVSAAVGTMAAGGPQMRAERRRRRVTKRSLFCGKVEGELQKICDTISARLDGNLIEKASDGESKVFYKNMRMTTTAILPSSRMATRRQEQQRAHVWLMTKPSRWQRKTWPTHIISVSALLCTSLSSSTRSGAIQMKPADGAYSLRGCKCRTQQCRRGLLQDSTLIMQSSVTTCLSGPPTRRVAPSLESASCCAHNIAALANCG